MEGNKTVCLVVLQLEVGGRITTKLLENLISQTEYSLTVTPVYDEGRGQAMLGSGITGTFECDQSPAFILSDLRRERNSFPFS